MANAILWQTTPTSRGTVLTTQLDGLANNAWSGVGTEINNSSNLDQWGMLEVSLASLNPVANQTLQFYMSQAPGGTNYEDPASSTNPAPHQLVATLVLTSGSATKLVSSAWFRLPPCKIKFVGQNVLIASGVALGATGNTVTLYTDNDEIQ